MVGGMWMKQMIIEYLKVLLQNVSYRTEGTRKWQTDSESKQKATLHKYECGVLTSTVRCSVKGNGTINSFEIRECEHEEEPGWLSPYSDRLWATQQGFDSRHGPHFRFSITSTPALGPTQPPIQWVPGVKSGRETGLSPPSSAEVKNGGAIPPLYYMSSRHSASQIKHRDNSLPFTYGRRARMHICTKLEQRHELNFRAWRSCKWHSTERTLRLKGKLNLIMLFTEISVTYSVNDKNSIKTFRAHEPG
jgi:hypothetical protein